MKFMLQKFFFKAQFVCSDPVQNQQVCFAAKGFS